VEQDGDLDTVPTSLQW